VLFYGEELGMGENLDIPGRLAVRTPMQWSNTRNGGFSDAAPSRLPRPLTEGGYGPAYVNAADQRTDPDSLLAFLRLLIRRYRESPELGWSAFHPLEQPHHDVLVHLCEVDDRRLVAVHNLANEGRTVRFAVDGCAEDTELVDLLEDGWSTRTSAGGRVELSLEPYGSRWLRLLPDGDRRLT
jgi:glycosidase